MRVKFTKAAACTGAIATTVAAGLGFAPAAMASSDFTAVPCSSAALVTDLTDATSGSTLLLAPFCTYTVAASLPVIDDSLVIVGDRSTIARSFAVHTPDFTILRVSTTGEVVLKDVNFVNGDAGKMDDGILRAIQPAGDVPADIVFNDGGAIDNAGHLTIIGGFFRGNAATNDGGAIYNTGSLRVNGALFTSNTAEYGAGIANVADLAGSEDTFEENVAGNYGGGIYSDAGRLALASSGIYDNRAAYGGGLYTDSAATVSHDTFKANSASGDGGAIDNRGDLSLTYAALSTNRAAFVAGGIYNSAGTTAISFSLINRNIAREGGGGIYNNTTVTLASTLIFTNQPDNCEPLGSVTGCRG